jgi:hypothetical protein
MNDTILAEFLKDLDDADHMELTDWEAEFLESNLGREKFSDKQRAVIERMKTKYQDKL